MSQTLATTIQSVIELGYAQAANVLGQPCNVYRYQGNPLTPPLTTAPIANVFAAFDVKPTFDFVQPDTFGKFQWYALVNAADFEIGDYFVHPQLGTFFIDGLNPLESHSAIRCNRTLTFSRPGDPAPSAAAYSGDVTADEIPLLTGWPASVLQGSKGEQGATKLPGDGRMPWVSILLPSVAGVQLRVDDIVVDNEEIVCRYLVSSVETSSHGIRLTALQLAT